MSGKHDAGQEDGAFFRVFFNEELYLLKNDTAQTDAKGTDEQKAESFSEPAAEQTAMPGLVFSGNANAQTFVLFNNSDGAELPQAELALLQRILAAVKLNWEDVAWFNTAGKNELKNWASLEHSIKEGIILAFGLQPQLLPQGIVTGEPARLNNHWILSVEGLDIIGQSQEKKKILWDALQKIYKP